MSQVTPDAALPGTVAPLRNEPVQARSTARLSRLIDAAAEAVGEIGFERLTTAMVAERAGASIGTVYRYFPDRIAVLNALSARFLSEYVADIRTTLAADDLPDWQSALDAVVDMTADSFATKPGFRSLRFGDVVDVFPREDEKTHSAIVAGVLASSLNERFGLGARDQLVFRVEIVVRIIDSLLSRAFAFEPEGETAFVDEAKTVARDYLASHYTR